MRCARLLHLANCLLRAQIATQDAIEEHPTLLGPNKIAVRMNHSHAVMMRMRAIACQPVVAEVGIEHPLSALQVDHALLVQHLRQPRVRRAMLLRHLRHRHAVHTLQHLVAIGGLRLQHADGLVLLGNLAVTFGDGARICGSTSSHTQSWNFSASGSLERITNR